MVVRPLAFSLFALAPAQALAQSLDVRSEWTLDVAPIPPESDTASSSVERTCANHSNLHACEGEEGHYTAIRIVPPTTPFSVKGVTYFLTEGVPDPTEPFVCDSASAHDVFLFVADANQPPPADPVEEFRVTVPADPATGDVRRIDLVLPHAIGVGPGEALYVAVEMVGAPSGCRDGHASCLFTCDTQGLNSFWSNSAAPEYPWKALADFGIESDPVATMWGFYGVP
ncbi:MAG: hypothetical protein H6735_00570 [Alphaproteobacteria bacterium]|nr:hypothetical protein [Alphaproteobacteria bacterium]